MSKYLDYKITLYKQCTNSLKGSENCRIWVFSSMRISESFAYLISSILSGLGRDCSVASRSMAWQFEESEENIF